MNITFPRIPDFIATAFILALGIAIMFIAIPAQAGVSLHLGYGYSYPYYGHNYSGHYGYGRHNYPYRHHYGGYGYYSPYSSYNDYSSRPTYRDRGGKSIDATANGWSLLANNQASAALYDFGRQAESSPSKGNPKIGYALASADLGQLDKGVWAMRRALRNDPGSLHYVALDQNLDSKVKQIIQKYEKKLAYSSRDADAAFMLASLHYLRRDIKAAHNNIDQAMLARHVNTSTKNLRTLIDKETEE